MTFGCSWPYPQILDWLGRLVSDKHFGLFGLLVSDKEKNDTWAQCYKTFYGRIFRTSVVSYSVCKTWLERFAIVKHSSLVRKSVNHGQKSFITFGPDVNIIKLFSFLLTHTQGYHSRMAIRCSQPYPQIVD
jgi:hypothetical protein